MSIMRVHSHLSVTPHFPFLYPTDKANAMPFSEVPKLWKKLNAINEVK